MRTERTDLHTSLSSRAKELEQAQALLAEYKQLATAKESGMQVSRVQGRVSDKTGC